MENNGVLTIEEVKAEYMDGQIKINIGKSFTQGHTGEIAQLVGYLSVGIIDGIIKNSNGSKCINEEKELFLLMNAIEIMRDVLNARYGKQHISVKGGETRWN